MSNHMNSSNPTPSRPGAASMGGGPRGGQGRGGLGMGPGGPGGMGRPVEKAKNFKPTLIRLVKYLAPNKWRFFAVLILAVASTVFTIASPKIIGQAMDMVKDSFIARMVLDQMTGVQTKAREAITRQLEALQQAQAAIAARAAAAAAAEPGSVKPGAAASSVPSAAAAAPTVPAQATTAGSELATPDTALAASKMPSPETIKALKSFMTLPLLSDTTDPAKQADIVESMIAFLANLPPEYQTQMSGQVAENSLDNQASAKASGSGFTKEQMDEAIRAIRLTGGKIDYAGIGAILLWLLALYLMAAGFTFATQWIMSTVAQRTVYDLRKTVDQKLGRLPLSYYDGHAHGDVLSRVTNDVDTISSTLQQSLTQAISSVVQIIGFIIMMLSISWLLTLIVIATLPLYVLATMTIAKKSQKYFASQQKELGALSGHVEEMFTGHVIVKAYGRERQSVATFEEINVRLAKAASKANFISGIMWPAMNFISNLGYVMISVVGGIWITGGRLTLGDIVAFIQYSRSFTQPIIQTANIANIIQSTVACAERVFQVLDEPEESADPAKSLMPRLPKGEVSIKNLAFRYVPETPLIEDLSLEVKPGHTIAIVGPTGAGKTTLVNLLMRFYETNAGSISIDGVKSTDMSRADLRSLYGMVLQDTWLFNGTIRDNIAYGKDDASEAEILRAATAAHADHFIRTLPEGYDTVLNEEATNISQGQKQLLTIARAILANPAILILDEATSSVDTRTEVLIQKAMNSLMEGRTSFVIAHRLSTIRDAESILVMDKGSIVEQGTHDQLLAKNGFYASLYNAQFAGSSI